MTKSEAVEVKMKVPSEVWIGRLTDLLKIIDAMEAEERTAALSFVKSKYYNEWPRGDY